MRIHVVEAKNLMKKDITVLGKGKSDPYAILTVGAQQFRTQTIDNTVDPKWDYWCEVSGQQNRRRRKRRRSSGVGDGLSPVWIEIMFRMSSGCVLGRLCYSYFRFLCEFSLILEFLLFGYSQEAGRTVRIDLVCACFDLRSAQFKSRGSRSIQLI